MALTELQRDAIAKARQGDFSLVDAMELAHRIETHQVHVGFLHGGRLVLFGKVNGDLKCDECDGKGQPDCHACEGTGEEPCWECQERGTLTCVDCDGDGCDKCDEGRVVCDECDGKRFVDCEECAGKKYTTCDVCGGSGYLDYDEVDRGRTITDFYGDVVFDSADDDPWLIKDPTVAKDMDTVGKEWADKILTAYHKAKREAAEAAAEAAKPPLAAGASRGQQPLIPENF